MPVPLVRWAVRRVGRGESYHDAVCGALRLEARLERGRGREERFVCSIAVCFATHKIYCATQEKPPPRTSPSNGNRTTQSLASEAWSRQTQSQDHDSCLSCRARHSLVYRIGFSPAGREFETAAMSNTGDGGGGGGGSRNSKRSALDLQRAQLSLLSRKPHLQPTTIPSSSSPSTSTSTSIAALPTEEAGFHGKPLKEIHQTTSSATSGAGSGEFHVYRASRRRELARVAAMESTNEREVLEKEYEARRRKRELEDRDRTERNQEKRRRRRDRKKMKQVLGDVDASKATSAGAVEGKGDPSSSSDDEAIGPAPATLSRGKKAQKTGEDDSDDDDDDNATGYEGEQNNVKILDDDDD